MVHPILWLQSRYCPQGVRFWTTKNACGQYQKMALGYVTDNTKQTYSGFWPLTCFLGVASPNRLHCDDALGRET
jgi:hypothetical protein